MLIIPAAQGLQNSPKIVVARARMPAIQLVDMHVADQIEIPIDQRSMRFGLVHRVVRIEHGTDRGATDLSHDRRRFDQTVDHVGLLRRQEPPPGSSRRGILPAAPPRRVRRRKCLAASAMLMPCVVERCLGEPNTMTPPSPKIRAEVDQIADMLPAALPQAVASPVVTCKPAGENHQPVEPYE